MSDLLRCLIPLRDREERFCGPGTPGFLVEGDIVWVDFSNTEHDSFGDSRIPPWPGKALEVLYNEANPILSHVKIGFFEEEESHTLLIARCQKFVGISIESTDVDVSLNDFLINGPFGSLPKNDVFCRNWRFMATGWNITNANYEAWQGDVLHYTTEFLEERLGKGSEPIVTALRNTTFEKKMKALELLVLAHYMSPKLQQYQVTGSPIPNIFTPPSNKRSSSSSLALSPRSKAKVSKTSTSSPPKGGPSNAPVDAPTTPPPTSKWNTVWACSNCLNHNTAVSYNCEYCGTEQPDPATSDCPMIIVDEVTSPSPNKALKSKGKTADEAIDLISSDEEEEPPQASVKVKQEFPAVGFGEADQPPDVIEVERPDWAPLLMTDDKDKSKGGKPAAAVVEDIAMDDGEELVVLFSNTTNSLEMPHSRCDCLVNRFLKGRIDHSVYSCNEYIFTATETKSNSQTCPKCYCYVCQSPAPCSKWTTGKYPHCNASRRMTVYQRGREFNSDPFKKLVLDALPGSDLNSLIPSKVSSLFSEMQSQARTIDRQRESYLIGRQERTQSYNPMQAVFGMLGMDYDSDNDGGYGDYVHEFQNLYDNTKSMLKSLEDMISEIEVHCTDEPEEYAFLSASMRLLNMMSKFFKVNWQLPHRNDMTTIKHKEDPKAKEQHGELITMFERTFARLVLNERCEGEVQEAMMKSLKKVASSLSSEDMPIESYVNLLELQWDPSSPIGVLYSGRFSKRKEKLEAVIEAIESDPVLSAEPLAFKQVRAKMILDKDLETETTMYRAIIGDYEALIMDELVDANEVLLSSGTFLYDNFQEHMTCAFENFIKCEQFTIVFTNEFLIETKALLEAASIKKMDSKCMNKERYGKFLCTVTIMLLKMHQAQAVNKTISVYNSKGDSTSERAFSKILMRLSREFMKQNYFTVTQRSCNYPKSLELPLDHAQAEALKFVLSTSPASSNVPSLNVGLSTIMNLVGCMLGCYLHTSNIINTGGCGRPGCDCGYDEEVGLIGSVGDVVREMIDNKDFINVVLILHAMEAEKKIKPDSVDKVAAKIIQNIWTFPHSQNYSSPTYKKSRKVTAQDKKVSFKHLPLSAVTRWIERPEESQIGAESYFLLLMKILDEGDVKLLNKAVIAFLTISMEALNEDSATAGSGGRKALKRFRDRYTYVSAVNLSNKFGDYFLVPLLKAVNISTDEKTEIITKLLSFEPSPSKIKDALSYFEGIGGISDEARAEMAENCVKCSTSNLATKFETLYLLEAWEELESLLAKDKGKSISVQSLYYLFSEEGEDGISSSIMKSQEAQKKIIPLVSKWVLSTITAMVNPNENDHVLSEAEKLAVFHPQSSIEPFSFRENLNLSHVFCIFEKCSAISSHHIPLIHITDALNLVESCVLTNIRKATAGEYDYCNDQPLKCAESGNPAYPSSDDTRTGIMGFPGFLPPQVLLTVWRLSRNTIIQRQMDKKIQELMVYASNHMMAMYRVRYSEGDARGDIDFEAYFTLIVEIGGGEENVEEMFGEFIKMLSDVVWRKPVEIKASLNSNVGKKYKYRKYTSIPQFLSTSYISDIDDLLFTLDNFFLAYLDHIDNVKASDLFKHMSRGGGFTRSSFLKDTNLKPSIDMGTEEILGKRFARRGMFERVILLAFGELRATIGDETFDVLKDPYNYTNMFEKRIAIPMSLWLKKWSLMGRSLKDVSTSKMAGDVSISSKAGNTKSRNNLVGPLLSLMYSPRHWDHNVSMTDVREETQLRNEAKKFWESVKLPKDVQAVVTALTQDVVMVPAVRVVNYKLGARHPVKMDDMKQIVQAFRYSDYSMEIGGVLHEVLCGNNIESSSDGEDAVLRWTFTKGLMCLGDLESPKGFRGKPASLNLQSSQYRPSFMDSECCKPPSNQYRITTRIPQPGPPTSMIPQFGQLWFVKTVLAYFSSKRALFDQAHEFVFNYADIMMSSSSHYLTIFEGSNRPENNEYFSTLRNAITKISQLKIPKEDENDFLSALNLLKFVVDPSTELMEAIKKDSASLPEGLIGVDEFFTKCESMQRHKHFLSECYLYSGDYTRAAKLIGSVIQDAPSVEIVDAFLGSLCELKPSDVVAALLEMMPHLGWLGGYIGKNGDMKSLDVDMLVGEYKSVEETAKEEFYQDIEGRKVIFTNPKRTLVDSNRKARSVRLRVLATIATWRAKLVDICLEVPGPMAAKAAYMLYEGDESFKVLAEKVGDVEAEHFAKECAVCIEKVGPEMMLKRFELAGTKGWGLGSSFSDKKTEMHGVMATLNCLFPLSEDRCNRFAILTQKVWDTAGENTNKTKFHPINSKFRSMSLKYPSCAIACASMCVFIDLFGDGSYETKSVDYIGTWNEVQRQKNDILKNIGLAKVSKSPLIDPKAMTWFKDPSLENWEATSSVVRDRLLVPVLGAVLHYFLDSDVKKGYHSIGAFPEESCTDLHGKLSKEYVDGAKQTYWMEWLFILKTQGKVGEAMIKKFSDKLYDYGCDIITGCKFDFTAEGSLRSPRQNAYEPFVNEIFGNKFRQNVATLKKQPVLLDGALRVALVRSLTWSAKLALGKWPVKMRVKSLSNFQHNIMALYTLNTTNKLYTPTAVGPGSNVYAVNKGLMKHFQEELLTYLINDEIENSFSNFLLVNQVNKGVKTSMHITFKNIHAWCKEGGEQGMRAWAKFLGRHMIIMRRKKPYLKALSDWKKENKW